MAEENKKHLDNTRNDLTWKHRLGYSFGDMGGVVTLTFITTYLMRYMTAVLGISFATTGIILFIWNMWDMLNDPLVGGLMDRAFAKAKPGQDKFRPWILASVPVIVFGLIAFVTVPNWFDGLLQIVAVFLLKIVYEFGYTMMNIAMGSILSVMALNDTERTTLSSARGIGSTVGSFIAMFFIPQILDRLGETPEGYAAAGIFAAVAGGILIFMHYLWTEERNKAAQKVADEQDGEQIKWSDIFVTLRKNKAFLALCLHSIVIVLGQTMNQQATTFIVGDIFFDPGAMSWGTVVQTGLSLLLLFLAPSLIKVFGSTVNQIRTYLVISAVLFVALMITVNVTDISATTYIVWMYAALGFMMMSVQLQWGLVGQSIDYNEYITGKRNEGTIYGFFSLTRRLGTVLAQSTAAWIIGWIGYDASLAEAGAAQADSTINGLFTMNLVVPAICAIGSFLIFTFLWNIDDELAAKISAFTQGLTGDANSKD